jgi:FAD:protein FMN transferase
MLGAVLLSFLQIPAQAAWHSREAAIMGTRISVEVWHDSEPQGLQAITAVFDELHRIDALMSHYKPESQLSRINAQAGERPVVVDLELYQLLQESQRFSKLTQGAFDITYASVGYLYDYRKHVKPDETAIRAALPAVDYRQMQLDSATHAVRFNRPGMRIDLGGIAKGYAVDRGIELLRSRGITQAAVTAGGDTRILGDRRGQPWLVGIRHPDDPEKLVTRIPLADTAMSTSGDYERYFDAEGVRYHHIIDPRSGHSARGVRSATILGPTALQTDGLSKTAFVLGAEKTLEIINGMPEFDAIVVLNTGKVLYSNGLSAPSAAP